MRAVFVVGALAALSLASAGCESILGIDDHKLAPQAEDGGSEFFDSGGGEDGSSSDAGKDGSSSDTGRDGGHRDAAEEANSGGAVPPACADNADACVFGGIFSVGQPSDDAGVGSLPDGAPVTLTDDGFEFGGTSCDDAGTTCATGGLTP